MITIRQISKSASVSIATVSRVLNKNPHVSPELCLRVHTAIDSLGGLGVFKKKTGRPKKIVSGFKSGVVALVIPDSNKSSLVTPLTARLCKGFEKRLRDHGLNLLLTGLTEQARLPENIEKNRVDGLFFRSLPIEVPGIPIVLVLDQPLNLYRDHDVASEDNGGIGIEAVSLLLERGHRRLGLIIPDPNNHSFTTRSLYFRSHAELNKVVVDTFVVSGENSHLTFMEDCFSQSEHPTGYFITGLDSETLMLVRLLREKESCLGKRFDLVCCYNDLSQIALFDPRTLVLDIQAEEIGSAAVDLLIRRKLDPEALPRKIIVPYRVIAS